MIDRKAQLGIAGLHADYCNVHRDADKHPETFSAEDFLPELPEEREACAAEEAKAREATPSKEEMEPPDAGHRESACHNEHKNPSLDPERCKLDVRARIQGPDAIKHRSSP